MPYLNGTEKQKQISNTKVCVTNRNEQYEELGIETIRTSSAVISQMATPNKKMWVPASAPHRPADNISMKQDQSIPPVPPMPGQCKHAAKRTNGRVCWGWLRDGCECDFLHLYSPTCGCPPPPGDPPVSDEHSWSLKNGRKAPGNFSLLRALGGGAVNRAACGRLPAEGSTAVPCAGVGGSRAGSLFPLGKCHFGIKCRNFFEKLVNNVFFLSVLKWFLAFVDARFFEKSLAVPFWHFRFNLTLRPIRSCVSSGWQFLGSDTPTLPLDQRSN